MGGGLPAAHTQEDTMKLKHCIKCGRLKQVDQFNCRLAAKDGKQSYCRACQHGYNIEHEPQVLARLSELDKKFTVTVLPNGVTVYKHKEFDKVGGFF